MPSYDVVVIGSGPGGYVAAIRSARLGLKTAIVERENLGGVCLNWGCIPTKALLESAHFFEKVKFADKVGIKIENATPDFKSIIDRSRSVANQMNKGVDYLMRKNNIDVINGTARFIDSNSISIENNQSVTNIEARRFIVAVGARARSLPNIKIDENRIISYRQAMLLTELPRRLCVVGAGAIGIEYADFYRSLGSEVTIIEAMPHILPVEDEEISAQLAKSFQDRGIVIHTETKLNRATGNDTNVEVEFIDRSGKTHTESFDRMLLAAGIVANTDQLNLEVVNVDLERDRIKVNQYFQTSNPSIYAIGDCISGPALAHVASHEGIHAAESIYVSLREAGVVQTGPVIEYEPMQYQWIPSCTYCHPEVASAGLTEKKAKEQGFNVLIGKFPFRALGRARASGEADGFVKILVDKEYHRLLGIHIIGSQATEMISEVVVAAEGELLADNLARTIHAHPTLSEGIMEAAAEAIGQAIHI
ncbi:MAG: dihydrolipoyl dehydrogenase [Leptonema sp. (in: Bacteria)]|nr:dihydrolipoyl dehydrogenase [Leptonema sp. (in: bacteria)]